MQCEDPQCRIVQHIGCVIIREKTSDGVQPEIPPQFYCDICRINRADPYVSCTPMLLALSILFKFGEYVLRFFGMFPT